MLLWKSIYVCFQKKKNKKKKKSSQYAFIFIYSVSSKRRLASNTCCSPYLSQTDRHVSRLIRFDCWLGVLYSISSIFSSFGYSISSYDSDFFLRRTDRGTYHYSSFCCMLIWSPSLETTSLVFGSLNGFSVSILRWRILVISTTFLVLKFSFLLMFIIWHKQNTSLICFRESHR
jgi:hypothetical protein